MERICLLIHSKKYKMEEFLVLIVIFGSLFGVVFLYFNTRHKERMALIEKGENADLFVTSKRRSAVPLYAILLINLGILGVGIGVGVLIGHALHMGGMDQDISMPSAIFICLGLALLGGFYITKNLDHKYRDEEI
jgi:hypothetical protein